MDYHPQANLQDNVRAVLQNLVYYADLPITQSSIFEAFQVRIPAGSLEVIGDILDEYAVPHLTVRLAPAQLPEISYPAIAHLHIHKGYFVMLHGCEAGKISYIDPAEGWKEVSIEEFTTQWSGVVLLIEPNEQSGEIAYTQKRKTEKTNAWRIPVAIFIGIMVGLSTIGVAWVNIDRFLGLWLALFVLKSVGLGVCGALLQYTIGQASPWLQKFCTTQKNTNCQTVLDSKAGKLWGWLSMAEIGLWYFTGGWLLLLCTSLLPSPISALSILLIFNVLALPYTVFSVYYQAWVAKQWCPLCLVVQGVFWLEFVSLSSIWQVFEIELMTAPFVIISLGLPLLIALLTRPDWGKKAESEQSHRDLARLKRNPIVFEALQQAEKPVQMETELSAITLGNVEAPLILTVVSNLYCQPCRKAHQFIAELLAKFSDDFQVRFCLACSSNPSRADYQASRHLLALASLDTDTAIKALADWYATTTTDFKAWQHKYPLPTDFDFSEANRLLQAHLTFNQQNKIQQTPALFIQDRPLPEGYDVTDLTYLIPRFAQSLAVV
jgi:uncharacterized membrane protein